MKLTVGIIFVIILAALVACGGDMTPLQQMQRDGRDAQQAAAANLRVGNVAAVHPVLDAAGEPTGQALYDVRIRNRRGQDFLMRHVGSTIPVQVGHSVFIVQLGGHHSAGAWITGLTHPPTPQRVEGSFALPAFTALAGGIREVTQFEEAMVITAPRTVISAEMVLPAVTGEHETVLSGLTLWPGDHDIHTAAQHTHGADDHQRHLIIDPSATMTGGVCGATVRWVVDVRMTHADSGYEGNGTFAHTATAVCTSATVTDNLAARTRTWRITNSLLTPDLVSLLDYDTRTLLGETVDLTVRMSASFPNASEYTLPGTWAFSPASYDLQLIEQAQGSALR